MHADFTPNIEPGNKPQPHIDINLNPDSRFGMPHHALFNAYSERLSQKIESGEMGYDGAANYARAVKRFHRWVSSGEAGSSDLIDVSVEQRILHKDEAGELLDRYFKCLNVKGATKQAINANRSMLFQFYRWANEAKFTEFNPANAGYLAPQLAQVMRPAVVLEWAQNMRNLAGVHTKAVNQWVSTFTGFINYLACTLYPPDGKGMNLKGEWKALDNIRHSKEDVETLTAGSYDRQYKTVTAHMLLKAAEWVPRYLDKLKSDGISAFDMRRHVYACRQFYDWASRERLSTLLPELIVNPMAKHTRRLVRFGGNTPAVPKAESVPHESKQARRIRVTQERQKVEQALPDPQLAADTAPSANSVVHSERAKILNFDCIMTMLLALPDLPFSSVRSLRPASISFVIQALQLGAKFVDLKPIFADVCKSICVVHGIRELKSLADFPASSRSLVSGSLENVFAEEKVGKGDSNAIAFVNLRDKIMSFFAARGLSFRQQCELPFANVRTISGHIRITGPGGMVTPSGEHAKAIADYIQLGRIYIAGTPFQSTLNPVRFLLTLHGEPITNLFD